MSRGVGSFLVFATASICRYWLSQLSMVSTNGNNYSNGNNRKHGEVTVEIFAAGGGINYPQQGQEVIIHYTACLKDGPEFDSTRKRKPFRFHLLAEQVIPGLETGVSQLSIGEQAKITIPSSEAYAEKGFPGLVPANADLVFEVELLSFA